MKRYAIHIALGMVLLAGCSQDKKLDPGDETEGELVPTSKALSRRELRANPIVEVEGDRITLDGAAAGEPGTQRSQRVEELFNALSKRREAVEKQSPAAFKGVCGLRVSKDLPLASFVSVFQTIADAGYPGISVQTIEQPEVIVDFTGVFSAPGREMTPVAPHQVLNVYAGGPKPSLMWTQGSIVSRDAVTLETADLARIVCEEWKQRGSHTAVSDDVPDDAVLHLPDAGTMIDAQRYVDAILSCKRDVSIVEGSAPKPQPVFRLMLARW